MTHTEELREELAIMMCAHYWGNKVRWIKGRWNGGYIPDNEKNDWRKLADQILSKLKELNYQKVRSRPIMIAGEAAGNKDGPAMLKAVQIMVKEGYKYCEPIDIGGTNEDK